MDVLTAIATRRSVGQVLADKPVADEVIESLLQAACWAPNHHRSEPWRFTVFTGEGRKHFASALVKAAQNMPKDEQYDMRISKAEGMTKRAPVIIAVHCAAGEGPGKPAPVWEEHAAVAAAVQNLLLAAHGQGLGAIWRSGVYTEAAEVQAYLGVRPEKGDRIMGFVYLGYPDPAAEPMRPVPKSHGKTRWVKE